MASGPLVDVHVHLYPDVAAARRAKDAYVIWEYGDDPGVSFCRADGLLEEVGDRFGAAGFDHAVVLQLFDVAAERDAALARLEVGLGADETADAQAQLGEALARGLEAANRWVVEATSADPLLTAYVGIDPILLGGDRIVEHLDEMAALGARGVKLHPVAQGFQPSDARLDALWARCCELDLVVLSHSGPGHRASASSRPGEFAPVLERFPSLRLVLAHLGGAAFREAADLAADFASVSFDLSEIIEWVGAENAPDEKALLDAIRRIGADRVMLGSDFPWYDPADTAERVASLPGLGAAERVALLGASAVQILGLDGA